MKQETFHLIPYLGRLAISLGLTALLIAALSPLWLAWAGREPRIGEKSHMMLAPPRTKAAMVGALLSSPGTAYVWFGILMLPTPIMFLLMLLSPAILLWSGIWLATGLSDLFQRRR